MHSFSTDQSGRHQRYITIGAVSAVIYLGSIWLLGPIIGVTIGLFTSSIYIVFTKWLWKWDLMRDIGLVSVPDLNGRWEGYLYTSADRELILDDQIVTHGRQIDEFTKQETAIEIKQTWDKISVTLDGPESQSHSRAATILVNEKAWPTLTYNYLNEGSNTKKELNAHYGTAILEYFEEEDKLEGKYYNRPDQRENHGVLELCRTD